ncbi:MAG: tetratricopeptide repeat protein [Candidatus Thermoplasmatota archaeon]
MKPDKFIGRRAELMALRSHLSAVERDEPVVILISGEPGIGKARIAEEFIARYCAKRLVVRHYTLEKERREPYAGLRALLEHTARRGYSADEVLALLAGKGLRQQEEIEREREILSRKVMDYLTTIPNLVILIADMHHLDDGSSEIIEYLAAHMKIGGMLFIGTYAPELLVDVAGAAHPLAEGIADLMMEGKVTIIPLERMGKDDLSRLVADRLGVKKVPQQLLEVIWKVTEGSPLYAIELVGSLLEQGAIDPRQKGWARKFDPSKISVPKSVKDAIHDRLARLDEREHTLLSKAAVIGTEFKARLLREISGLDPAQFRETMGSLASNRFVHELTEADEETYRFDHSQVRDVIYGSIGPHVSEMHRRTAEAIEDLAPDPSKEAYTLAHHYDKAGMHEKAAAYGLAAAENAFAMSAPQEALRYLSTGVQHVHLAERTKEMRLTETRLTLLSGNVKFHTGEWDDALRDLERAFTLAEKVVSPELMAAASRSMGEVRRFRGDYAAAEQDFKRALDIAEGADAALEKTLALRGLGYVAWRTGAYETAEQRYTDCLSVARLLRDTALEGSLMLEMGNVHSARGNIDEAEKSYLRSIELCKKAGSIYDVGRAYNNIGDTYLQREEWDKAILYFGECARVSEQMGNKDMLGWAHFNLGEAYAKKGEVDRAEKECREALRILRQVDDKVGIAGVYKNLGIVSRLRKEWDEAEEHFRKSAEMEEEMSTPHPLAETLIEWGIMRGESGDMGRARELLERAIQISEGIKAEKFAERAKRALRGLG